MERRAEKLPRFRIPGIVDIKVTPPPPFAERSDNFHKAHKKLLDAKRGMEFVEQIDGEDLEIAEDLERAQNNFRQATRNIAHPRRGIEVVIFGGAVRRKLR